MKVVYIVYPDGCNLRDNDLAKNEVDSHEGHDKETSGKQARREESS